jgi:hypothetical protein
MTLNSKAEEATDSEETNYRTGEIIFKLFI